MSERRGEGGGFWVGVIVALVAMCLLGFGFWWAVQTLSQGGHP